MLSDHHRVAADCHRGAEIVVRLAIGRSELGGLDHVRPSRAGLSEHIGRSLAAGEHGVLSDHHRVAADRHRGAEIVVRRAIRRSELGSRGHFRLRIPTGARFSEHVGRSLIAIGAHRGARRPDHHRITADRNRFAEPIRAFGCGELGGLGHVRPSRAGLSEHVGRSLPGVAVTGGDLSNYHRVAADRNRTAETVANRAIGGSEHGLLHPRINGDYALCPGVIDVDQQVLMAPNSLHFQRGWQGLPRRVVGHQPGVAQCRRAIRPGERQPVAGCIHRARQVATQSQFHRQRTSGFGLWQRRYGKPLL